MFRIIFTAYLAVVALMGFNPCCCTLVRLVAVVGLGQAQGGHIHSCCSVIENSGEKNAASKSDGVKTKPLQERQRCVCAKHASCCSLQSLKVVKDRAQADAWLSNVQLVSVDFLSGSLDIKTKIGGFLGSPPSALLSGRSVRVTLCSWRC